MLLILTGSAQNQTTLPPQFDAVSIKPSKANRNGPVRFEPGRAYSGSVSAYRIVLAAYNLKEYQVIGATGWIDSDWYALEAKTQKPADENRLRLMLQILLRQRFSFVAHREIKETPVYSLVVGKSGMKLQQWGEGDPIPKGAGNETMESLVTLLNLPGFQRVSGLTRPVLNKTGLRGSYLVLNSWYDKWDDFQTAVLEDKMGLKLVPEKAPMNVLVIDHMEKPSAN